MTEEQLLKHKVSGAVNSCTLFCTQLTNFSFVKKKHRSVVWEKFFRTRLSKLPRSKECWHGADRQAQVTLDFGLCVVKLKATALVRIRIAQIQKSFRHSAYSAVQRFCR